MKSKYVIRCGSRTGSTVLCELLSGTNRCGNPQEYFNPSLIESYRRQLGVPIDAGFEEYKRVLLNKTATENRVFGTKIVGVGKQWTNYLDHNILPTHWIRIEREDKVLQAISRYKAWTTGKWSFKTGQKPPTEVDYSFFDIKWCLQEIEKEESEFDLFFQDKDHLRIKYEVDILENPEQTVVAILSYLNISIDDLPIVEPKSIIIRDEQSYVWKDRFLTNGWK